MQYTHQSVRDYVAAMERGDRAETDRIKSEVIARFEARTTDGSELVELGRAAEQIAFAEGE
jgi:transposase